jgi:hypothetical protein
VLAVPAVPVAAVPEPVEASNASKSELPRSTFRRTVLPVAVASRAMPSRLLARARLPCSVFPLALSTLMPSEPLFVASSN